MFESGMQLKWLGSQHQYYRSTTYESNVLYPLRFMVDCAVVGGNSLVTTSVEIAHPFTASLPSVWWAAFVDTGSAAARLNALKMETGYGVGVRWRSPVGPLNIDLSFPDDFSKPRLDLSVGVAF